MDVSEVTRNLSSLGGAKWDMHVRARALAAAGHPIIELTIGEPDEPMAPALVPAMAPQNTAVSAPAPISQRTDARVRYVI